MQNIINIVVFILILGSIIFIHELGHFIAAKTFGIYAPVFSLGMGPKIFGKKIGETEYQLRLLPIGGFVSMAGEVDQEDEDIMKDVPYERTLPGIKTWKRCIIMLAGVAMNFIMAFTILVSVYSLVDVVSTQPIIGSVVESSAADLAGIQSGDTICKIFVGDEEKYIASFDGIGQALNDPELIKENPKNLDVKVEVQRDEELELLDLSLKFNETDQIYQLGVYPSFQKLTFTESIKMSITEFSTMSVMVFKTFGQLITNTSETVGQLSGPIGIFNVSAQVTQSQSLSSILILVAMLSINIGVFNLIPIPGLDGYHVVIACIERVIGRDLPLKLKYAIQITGLVALFGLMIYVTFNDILKLF